MRRLALLLAPLLVAASLIVAIPAHAAIAWSLCYGDGVHTSCVPHSVPSNRSPSWSVPVQTGTNRLTFQSDCNLVNYDAGYPNGVSWATNTTNIPRPCQLKWQSDGNVVIYDANNVARWASATNRGLAGYVMYYSGNDCIVIDKVTTTVWRNHSYCAHP